MSAQAKQILDSIKTDPTNWTYQGTRWRRSDGVIEVKAHRGTLFPEVTIFTPSRDGWRQDEIELPLTLMQSYTFGKLDRKAWRMFHKQAKEMDLLRSSQAIQQLLDRRPPIEINPPAPTGQQVVI